MKKFKICLWLLIMFPSFASAASNAFVPPSGKTLLLVGQDRDTIAQYVWATGTTPGGTMLYTSVKKLEGLQAAANYGSGPEDGNALLQSYPHSAIQVGLFMVDELGDTIQGVYDSNLSILAQWIINANRPVYLRIGYEFDNVDNHYDPDQYKQAFRYVVNFMRRAGVHNAAYVWHSNCWDGATGHQWMDWYPGDNYVDWFGASIFNVPSQFWTAGDFIKLARDHHKPFMIAESTPWGMYTKRGKLDFLNHIFTFIEDQNIEAFCYIDSNWDAMPMYSGKNIGDARIETDPDIKDLWLKETKNDRYLQATPDLFQTLGWKNK